MLSTENPQSPDPLRSCSPRLIKSSDITNLCGDDEKASHGNNQPLQLPCFDDRSSELLSNFSIRDYVFSTRGKDIKAHWPFSPRKLQLCLKNGVKDVLPPFEPLESLRINSSTTADDITAEDSKANPHLKITCLSKNLLSTPPSNKRRGLLVKLSNIAATKSTKEAMKTPAVAADSKVCPVCKTFSSSSNTTLNAHIDQCLSGGPVSNGVANSRAVKHRIKPRKTRLMVDVYATALHCTLEDLDRRNGTNWASSSGQANSSVGGKDPISCMKFPEEDVEGSVYVDSTGTKLRILSKFAHLPSNAEDDCSKGDKGTKFLSSRKKYLLHNRKSSSRAEIPNDHHCHKTADVDQRNVSSKKGCKKLVPKHRVLHDQVKPDDFGTVKQRVESKRTTLKKKKKKMMKYNVERESHRICKTTKNLRVKSCLSSQVRDVLGKEIIEPRSPVPAESLKGKKNSPFYSRNEHIKHPRLRMRKEINVASKRSDHTMHSSHKDRGKHDSSALECSKDLRNDTEAFLSSSSGDEDVRTNVRLRLKASVTKGFVPRKNSSLDPKKLLRGNNFSPVNHPSAADSDKAPRIKLPSLRKRKLRYVSDSDDDVIMVGTSTDKSSSGSRFTNLKAQKKIRELANSGNNQLSSKNAEFCVDDDVTAGTPDGSDGVKEVQPHEELARDIAASVTIFNESLASALPQIPHYGDFAISNGADADEEGHGNYYYADIDPISIPGPPGSFLPSPRHIGSDENHGISSLTTCRLPSPEDEREVLVRMDSSDSPASAASIVTSSVADGSSNSAPEAKIGATVERSSRIESGAGGERKEELGKPRTDATSPHCFVNGRPCCCSFKDGVFQTGSVDFDQDSQLLLRRRNMNSLPLLYNQTNDHIFGKSPSMVHINGHVSHYGSPSPSTPNPVLRLMGKNLMVVNNEENPSPQTRPPISAVENESTIPQCYASKVNNIHSGSSSLSNIGGFGQGPHSMLNSSQRSFASPNGFQTPAAGLIDGANFPRKSFGGNYMLESSFEGCGYSVGFKPNYEPGKVQAHARTRPKEVIVIDDSSTEHGGGVLAHDSSFFGHETRNADTQNCTTHAEEKWNNFTDPQNATVLMHRDSSFPASIIMPLTGHPLSSSCFNAGFSLHRSFS